MKNRIIPFTFLITLLFASLLSGCSFIGDIFKAGIWIGVVGVVALIVLVIYLIRKLRK